MPKSLSQSTEAWLRAVLYSIADAVIATDARGRVMMMNPVAEKLTGWKERGARGKAFTTIFTIINEKTHKPGENPVKRVLRQGVVIRLANHTVLISRKGKKFPIAYAGAPIRDESGKVVGVVLVFRDQTAERTAQRAVQDAREFAESIIATMRESLLVLDEKLEVVAANRSFYNVFKVKPEETIGKKIYHLGNRQWNIPTLRKLLEDILPSNSHFNDYEVTHDFEHIGRRTMLLNARRLFREANRSKLILLGIEDITERKRVEQATQRLGRILESSFNEIYIFDATTLRFLQVNAGARHNLGYTMEELRRLTPLDLKPEFNRESFEALIAPLRTGMQERIVFETIHLRKDGSTYPVEVRLQISRTEESPVFVAIIQDITEHKRAEELLRESEERFRTVAEQTGQLVYDYNPSTGAIAWAGAIERLTGFTVEEFQGFDIRRWEEHIHPDDRHQALQLLEQAMSGQGEYRAEYRFRRKDDSYILVEDNGVFLFDKDRKPYRMLGTMVDITERKRAESLRLRLSQVLESIASDEALPKILERLIEAIEEYFPDMRGSVLLLDADGTRLRHGAAPSLPDDYNAAIDGLLIGPRVGSCGTAAYEKRLVIVEDIQTDPLWADFRDLAARHGLRACWSQPIIDHEGAVLGTLALYYQQPRKPAEAELEMINTAANIACIAIKRKRAEEALRQSELRYRTVVANAPVVLWALDREGKFTFSEGKGLERLGLKPGEVVGRSVFEVYRDVPEIIENNRQALEGKTITSVIEIGGVSFESHYAPLYGDRGEVIGAIGLAIDITERRQAEQALRDSENRYRALFEESRDAIYVSSPAGRFIDINQAGVELFGFASREELLNADIAGDLYWSPTKRREFERLMRRQGYVQNYELELKRKDGQKIIVLETATAVRDDAGNLIAYRGTLRDITTQRALEEHLRQAQKLESLGTLASGIAHDFNNILSIIMGHATLLQNKLTDPEKAPKSLEAIVKATERGASLVKQMLTFSRKAEVRFEPLDLNILLKEMQKMLTETFPKAIEIHLELEPTLPSIVADPTQMHQVVLNLCVNARDAMPKGGTLHIATRRVSASALRHQFSSATAREYVELTVADTGVGMDKHVRQRIFEPFFTTKPAGHGTGLGLSVVHGIVSTHSGLIDVHSSPGKGTTFRVYLPALEQPIELEKSAPAEPLRGGTETILVIEDEELLRVMVSSLLQSYGYTVLQAHDGDEGIRMYEQHRDSIALVLSDIGLPKISGEEVFRRLKAAYPDVRIILASGFLEPQAKAELLKDARTRFVQKPYRPEEVLQTIRHLLD